MIITQTPLRVSFFGGGTDFPEFYEEHGGAVLTTAINKYVYVIVKPRFDKQIRVTYRKAELVNSVKDIKHDIVRECLKRVGIDHGIEIITIGDVPAGTGLGSSSAVTVGLLKALHTYKGETMLGEWLAEEACYIERIVLGKPIGVQDQYISAYGGFRHFDFCLESTITKEVDYGDLFKHLVLFYTGKTREADKILKVQSKNISKNIKILQEMKKLTYKKVTGELLNKSWELKKKLGPISSSQIDRLYTKALKLGATGGKILGAGGGGFLLLYTNDPDKLRKSIKLTEIPIAPESNGSIVIFNNEKTIKFN